MEKLLKNLIDEVKSNRKELEKLRIENEKKQKEIVNLLAFQSQIQKQMLQTLIKINQTQMEDDGDN